MTDVAFHTGVADKLGYTCRLLRKAWRQGAQVVATGAPEALSRLDTMLWIFEHEEFVPHARLRAGERVAPLMARTPIWLADEPGEVSGPQVLVNLGPGMAPGFERFARVLEIVSDEPADAQQGRQRWRAYQSAGLTPKLHNAAAAAPATPEITRSRAD
ncbi:DNA polymerase III subunit chi [Aquabacterium sp.]|uniref:DNA polymerase III subunit chi n=1 Tax=Aquabacterium sp. TaxID=1872578 RepID=UPI002C9A5887|nr:DNA polymerase III subunit chi [Aquabacterium sp.]HSW07035.1 DNA polymerase III subunit chi [Aquabacterium sp.]